MGDRERFKGMLASAEIEFVEAPDPDGTGASTVIVNAQYEGFKSYWRFDRHGDLVSQGMFVQ